MQLLLLVVTEQGVRAAFVEVESLAALTKSAPKSYTDQKGLIIQADKALQELGKESEQVDACLFAVDPDWVQGGDIAAKHQPMFEQLAEKLSLRPEGFVVTSEALYQQAIQQSTLTSKIFVDVRRAFVQVTVVQRGTLLGIQKVGRSDNLGLDLVEALARFQDLIGQDHFPAQLELVSYQLDVSELAELQQQLLAGDWAQNLAFLHQPEVTVAEGDFLLDQLVVQAGQSLLASRGEGPPAPDFEAAEEEGTESTVNDQPPVETTPDSAFDFTQFDTSDNLTAVQPATGSSTALPDLESDSQSSLPDQTPITDAPAKNWWQKFQGLFLTDSDGPAAATQHGPDADPDLAVQPAGVAFTSGTTTGVTARSRAGIHRTKLTKPPSHWPFVGAGFGLGMLILLGVAVGFGMTQHRVTFALTLEPKTISTSEVIQLDPEATEPDAAKKVLPATVTTVEVSGEDFTDATGVKLIGESAAGTVKIFNKTTSEKTFEAGTRLSAGGQAYTLDEEVTVASASVEENDDSETKTFGQAEVSITATEIGAEGNQDEGTELTIASFDRSSYVAEAENGLSGGSSREIQVVSETDRANLNQQLLDKLIADAEAQLQDSAQPGQYFVTTGQVEITNRTYDAEPGDEAQTVALEMTVEVEAFGYQTADLRPLATGLLESEVPDNYRLSDQDPQILSSPVSAEDVKTTEATTSSNLIQLEADISAEVVPIIDAAQLADQVAGLPYEQASSQLRSQTGVADVSAQIRPALFRRFYQNVPESSKVEIRLQ